MSRNQALRAVVIAAALAVVVGCAGPKVPPDALRLQESSLELRAKQSRIFEAESEAHS